MSRLLLIAFATFITCTTRAQPPKPVLAIPNQVILQENFDQTMPLPKKTWLQRQGTRWAVEDGVLRGQQSSPEYQAAKQDHFGYEPRLSVSATPQDFIACLKIRFIGGRETAITPFIEFDHHVCRVRFSQKGAILLADHEVWKVAEAADFIWKPNQWYSITAERRGSEFVMQIADGPTLFADHSAFGQSASSGGNGLGVAGPRKGEIEIDDLTIWSIQKQARTGWPALRAKLPKLKPVQLKKPKNKTKTKKLPKANSTTANGSQSKTRNAGK
ncbi:MAG: hypothetical protein ACR2N1_00480 [Rubripirellula sp.]